MSSPSASSPDVARLRESGSEKRRSMLLALPEARGRFAASVAARSLVPAGAAVVVVALVAVALAVGAAPRAAREVARARLVAARSLLRREISPWVALGGRLAQEPRLLAEAREHSVGSGGEALSTEEIASLESRLSPSGLLAPDSKASAWLAGAVAGEPAVKAAFFTEASGVCVGGTRPDRTAVLSSRAWWRAALVQGAAIALPGPAQGIPLGHLAVTTALPRQDPAVPVGVLVLYVSVDEVHSRLEALGSGQADGSGLSLVDGFGSRMDHGDGSPELLALPPAPAGSGDFVSVELSGGFAVARAPLAGGVPLDRLAAAAAAPAGRAGAARRTAGPIGLAALVAGALATLLLIPYLRRAGRDLSALVRFARQTGAGEATAPPPVDRADEVGTLGRALVTSLESLRSSRVELERAKRTLEERVAERTAELNRVNAELKKRAEELATASRAKDEFLTSISHELRTPLNSIIGFTQLVRDGLAESPAEADSFLDQVLSASRHLLSLINDVLDLAKLEAGRVVLELSELAPAEVAQEAVGMVEAMARQKGLELRCDVPDDLPAARADRVRLRQVLLNLLQNSVKFTARGTVLVRVRASDGRRRLLFEVEDSGIGIPEEKRALVFEKFIQAEAGTTRRFGGTGLGLPISRLLVEAMGGKIGLEPGPRGVGTRVWFTVPTPGLEGR